MSSSGRSSGGASIAQGLAAARPGVPVTNFYFATDTFELSVANAGFTAWEALGKVSGNWNTPGSLTVGNGIFLTGTTGEFDAPSGTSIGLVTADFDIVTVGRGLRIAEGANGKQQTYGPLVAGTLAVANTSITASSRIFVCRSAGGTNPGAHYVSVQTAGTGYTVTSTNAADTGSGVAFILEPG